MTRNSSAVTFGYPRVTFTNVSRTASGNYSLRATNVRLDNSSVEIGTGLGTVQLDVLCKSDYPPLY